MAQPHRIDPHHHIIPPKYLAHGPAGLCIDLGAVKSKYDCILGAES